MNKELTASACLLMLLAGMIICMALLANKPSKSDFAVFYASSHALITQHSSNQHQSHSHLTSKNLNPPIVSVLLAPLAALSYPHALFLWECMNLVLLVTCVWFVCQYFEPGRVVSRDRILVLLACLLSYPIMSNFSSGQMGMVLLVFMLFTFFAARSQNDRVAGISLAIACSLKLFPGLLLLLFFLLKRYRVIGYCFMTSTIVFAIPLLFLKPIVYWHYWQTIHHVNWYAGNWNASVLGFLQRWTLPAPDFHVSGMLYGIYCIVSLVLIGLLIYETKRMKAFSAKESFPYLFSLFSIAMLLISPLGWIYYFTILIVPLFVLFRMLRMTTITNRLLLLLSSSLLLLNYPAAFQRIDKIQSFFQAMTTASLHFYGLVLLFFVFLSIGRRYFSHENHLSTNGLSRSELIFLLTATGLPSLFVIVSGILRSIGRI